MSSLIKDLLVAEENESLLVKRLNVEIRRLNITVLALMKFRKLETSSREDVMVATDVVNEMTPKIRELEIEVENSKARKESLASARNSVIQVN